MWLLLGLSWRSQGLQAVEPPGWLVGSQALGRGLLLRLPVLSKPSPSLCLGDGPASVIRGSPLGRSGRQLVGSGSPVAGLAGEGAVSRTEVQGLHGRAQEDGVWPVPFLIEAVRGSGGWLCLRASTLSLPVRWTLVPRLCCLRGSWAWGTSVASLAC